MIYTSTSYIDQASGNVIAEANGTNQWSDKTSWATMTWDAGYVNPMVWYTNPITVEDMNYYNLNIDSYANGKISYKVIESENEAFMTVYDRDSLGVDTYGSISTSTSTVKYGAASISLPGTTSSYATISNSAVAFGTGSWTIEFWAYPLDSSKDYQAIICNDSAGDQLMGIYWAFTGIKTTLRQNSAYANPIPNLTTSTWHHIAVSYHAPTETSRTYVNGYCWMVDDAANTGTNITSTTLQIGKGKGYISNYLTGSPVENSFNGYIDDLRISNICRYTGTLFSQVFTAPVAATTSDSNTIFLCSGERGIVDHPNIVSEVVETDIVEGDTNIPAFSKPYVMVGIQVDSPERGVIYSSKITPNNRRLDVLLNDVDTTTLTSVTTASNSSRILDLGRDFSRVLAVNVMKTSGLTDVGINPVVDNKQTPSVAWIKTTEGSQDYVYGGSSGSAIDPTTLTNPNIDAMVHILPEQFMLNGKLQSR